SSNLRPWLPGGGTFTHAAAAVICCRTWRLPGVPVGCAERVHAEFHGWLLRCGRVFVAIGQSATAAARPEPRQLSTTCPTQWRLQRTATTTTTGVGWGVRRPPAASAHEHGALHYVRPLITRQRASLVELLAYIVLNLTYAVSLPLASKYLVDNV